MYKDFFEDVKSYQSNLSEISLIDKKIRKTRFYQLNERKKLKNEKEKVKIRLENDKTSIFLSLNKLSCEDFMKILVNEPDFEVKAYSFLIPGSLNAKNPIIEKVEVYDRESGTIIAIRYDNWYEKNEPNSAMLNVYQIYDKLDKSTTDPGNLHMIDVMYIALAIKDFKTNSLLYDSMINAIVSYISKKMYEIEMS